MLTKSFNFNIPTKLIAMSPSDPRGSSKLVEMSETFSVHSFNNLLEILNKGDCIVINNTKVIPAQLNGFCENKKVSITLNKKICLNENTWSAFARPFKRIIQDKKIIFSNTFFAKVIDKDKNGEVNLHFEYSNNRLMELLYKNATLAIPPYILKKRGFKNTDYENYQTVFAEKNGAVASPTASLHFNKNKSHLY